MDSYDVALATMDDDGFGCASTSSQAERERDALEYLRGEIRAERISLGEITELQSLARCIEPGDTELLQWAGVPENEPYPSQEYDDATYALNHPENEAR